MKRSMVAFGVLVLMLCVPAYAETESGKTGGGATPMVQMCPQTAGEGQPGMMGMMPMMMGESQSGMMPMMQMCPMCQMMMGGGMMGGGMMGPGMMGGGMMRPGMMMGRGMMTADMMQMMMDMMGMQEKMMAGVKPEEKKQMMEEMGKMRTKMMSMKAAAMQAMDPMSRMRCAEGWMKKAMDLQGAHMKDPRAATGASQLEMMDRMQHAYECITGSAEPGGEASGANPAKADPHGH